MMTPDPGSDPGDSTELAGGGGVPAPFRPEDEGTFRWLIGLITQVVPHQPASDPYAEKITPKVIEAALKNRNEAGKRSHERRVLGMWLISGMAALALAAVCFLCWLFLSYGKSEHVGTIITALFAFVGGVGTGWVAKQKLG